MYDALNMVKKQHLQQRGFEPVLSEISRNVTISRHSDPKVETEGEVDIHQQEEAAASGTDLNGLDTRATTVAEDSV